mmetsp:Transcript_10009/g.24946  ORF Transcript_10009/g.24946 Transcript_10009/m.24946 type:complete len:200 (+) Transcript_10009:85-684(+)
MAKHPLLRLLRHRPRLKPRNGIPYRVMPPRNPFHSKKPTVNVSATVFQLHQLILHSILIFHQEHRPQSTTLVCLRSLPLPMSIPLGLPLPKVREATPGVVVRFLEQCERVVRSASRSVSRRHVCSRAKGRRLECICSVYATVPPTKERSLPRWTGSRIFPVRPVLGTVLHRIVPELPGSSACTTQSDFCRCWTRRMSKN